LLGSAATHNCTWCSCPHTTCLFLMRACAPPQKIYYTTSSKHSMSLQFLSHSFSAKHTVSQSHGFLSHSFSAKHTLSQSHSFSFFTCSVHLCTFAKTRSVSQFQLLPTSGTQTLYVNIYMMLRRHYRLLAFRNIAFFNSMNTDVGWFGNITRRPCP
jgi:hypothetical protein